MVKPNLSGGASAPSGGVASSVLVAVRVRPFHRGEDVTTDAHLVQVGGDGRTIHLAETPSSSSHSTTTAVGNNANASPHLGTAIRHSFVFDRVFSDPIHHHLHAPIGVEGTQPTADSANHQQDVYAYLGPLLCQHTMQSYNSCLFAYGQTGSGKTYSMVGRLPAANNLAASTQLLHSNCSSHNNSFASSTNNDDDGVVPRLCVDLFQRMRNEREKNASVTHRVECSFVEIYCERVRDLISGSGSVGGATTPPQVPLSHSSTTGPHSLRVRQHPSRGPYVEGAHLVPVNDATDVIQLLQAGLRERATAETKMNDQSSRSHAILQLHVTRVEVARTTAINNPDAVSGASTVAAAAGAGGGSAVVTKTRVSKISLVDLAGSERVLQSGATSGERFEEARNINLSLHSLGRVIQILADRSPATSASGTLQGGSAGSSISAPPQQFTVPPYRESVLTWLLSDSLGGNSKTIMLATVAPSAMCHSQTLNTLRFACIAKKVVNVASINEDSHFHRLVSELREQILRLTLQLSETKKPSLASMKDIESDADGDDGGALGAARRAAADAEAIVCEQSVTIREMKERIECLEAQVRSQDKALSAHNDAVEQLSRLRLDLNGTQEDLIQSKRRCGDLEAEIEVLRADLAAAASTMSGGSAWSREGSPGLDLELLNAELRHQLDELTVQRNTANMRRERAEVSRTEVQLKLDKALHDVRASEAARAAAQRELDTIRCNIPEATSSGSCLAPPVVRGLMTNLIPSPVASRVAPPRVVSAEASELAAQQRRLEIDNAVKAREEELSAEFRCSLAVTVGDVHELEQLLLEETESSQRHLLANILDAQMHHLHRNTLKTISKQRTSEAVQRGAQAARILLAEAAERADLVAAHMTSFAAPPREELWSWIREHAALVSVGVKETATQTLAAQLDKAVRSAKAQEQESSLLQASLQKLHRAREAATIRLAASEEENAKLFQMLSNAQTSHDETKEELRATSNALHTAEAALQTEEQRRRLENALEDDIDGLKGTLDELTSENRFVHATNSDMTSRYDIVIHKLRSERQRLHQEVNDVNTAHDLKMRQLVHEHRREKEELEDDRDRLAADVEELTSATRRLQRQILYLEQGHPACGGKPSSPRAPLSERLPNT